MKQSNQESLSALMDGELPADELRFLLRRLDHDETSCETWSRYHVIRAGLRREGVMVAGDGFAERVMARLDDAEVMTRGSGGRRRWLQWSAGGAIAAGVAAVALMVSQPHSTAPTMAPGASAVADAHADAARNPTAAPAQAAPVAPRWLTPNAPMWTTQPASATFYGGSNGNVVMPAAYSPRVAPYMNIRVMPQPPSQATRSRGVVRYVLMDPSRQQGGSR